MHLKRLEAQGFKTFAQKTTFVFLPPKEGKGGLTVIVGPNGSGKSNAADAIRWVMGEQSLRLLRGKSSEDVIFSGSSTRARSGVAEVTLFLENDSRPDIAFSEIALTRRLDRDGHSDYEINGEPAKLSDITLLLSQIGIAQRSYAVIGQGMVDGVLSASPAERKVFFDEAFGVRPFQLRREQTLRKMDEATRNLEQSRMLLRELEPRLEQLRKHVARREERAGLEQTLTNLERQWYGSEWKRLAKEAEHAERERRRLQEAETRLKEALAALPRAESAPQPATTSEAIQQARTHLAECQAQERRHQDARNELRTRIAVERARTEQSWSPLPLSKIVERVRTTFQDVQLLTEGQKSIDPQELSARLQRIRDLLAALLQELERPAPDHASSAELHALEQALSLVQKEESVAREASKQAEQALHEEETREQRARHAELEHERSRTRLERERFEIEHERSAFAVSLARTDERRSALLEEVQRHALLLADQLEALAEQAHEGMDPATPSRLQRLRSQLEWIGSIPEETLTEFEHTRTRVEFMQQQLADIETSLRDLTSLVQELDTTIASKRTQAFTNLNNAFSRAAHELFGGGEASLVEIQAEAEIDPDTGEILAPADAHAGIDILATPPGKRLKAVSLLSGGERALVSIALICAIMATNPSPFVVLDEVDAALDEANAKRFGEMLAKMALHTQCIVVTHNRTTMSHADAIYGVTMGEDGVSKILSMKLE